ncbi:Detected protein of unknown function [Hibiscus syriacus]|uniref:Uncharacterized protein n=1 Tax=Hibiscus syriacus TaxID=106335 RepID=A0A6A3B9R0_HIBSY|nr:Detected protein of unknown function [Hibiscus syriacus]
MKIKLQSLRQDFETLHIKGGEPVQSHEARLNRIEEKTEDKAFHVKGEAFPQKNEKNGEFRLDLVDEEENCWRRSKQEQASYVEQEDDEIKLFMAYQENAASHRNIWFLDSGCSNHITGVKSLFNEIDETFKQKVTLEDNKQIQVEGKCNVAVKISSSNVKLLYDVYYIPSLSQNLLSVGQLIATGYSIMFDDASCLIKDKKSDQTIVDICMTPNKLFPLVISDVQNHALANDVVERKNHTVVEMERSMLKAKGLPNQLWAKDVATAIYLLNLSPTRVVLNKTPYKAWYGKRPWSKAYRLYSPIDGKIIIRRNVIFNEDARWSWEENAGDVEFEIASEEEDPQIEVLQPPSLNLSSPPTLSSTSSNSSISSDDETPPKKFKTLQGTHDFLIICLYVDDMIYMGSSSLINEFKACMKKEFEMTDLGALQFFLGLEVKQVEDGIFVSQKKYDADLLKNLKRTGCKIAATPMNLNEKLKNDDAGHFFCCWSYFKVHALSIKTSFWRYKKSLTIVIGLDVWRIQEARHVMSLALDQVSFVGVLKRSYNNSVFIGS